MGILKQFSLICMVGLLPLGANAQCGGSFNTFKAGLKSEAVAGGIMPTKPTLSCLACAKTMPC